MISDLEFVGSQCCGDASVEYRKVYAVQVHMLFQVVRRMGKPVMLEVR